MPTKERQEIERAIVKETREILKRLEADGESTKDVHVWVLGANTIIEI